MSTLDVTVKVNGGLFKRDIPQAVRRSIREEALEKVSARMARQGRGLGAKRNVVDRAMGDLTLTATSTRHYPRTRGTSWQRKNIAIIKAMAPRVLRKAANRIVAEMGR